MGVPSPGRRPAPSRVLRDRHGGVREPVRHRGLRPDPRADREGVLGGVCCRRVRDHARQLQDGRLHPRARGLQPAVLRASPVAAGAGRPRADPDLDRDRRPGAGGGARDLARHGLRGDPRRGLRVRLVPAQRPGSALDPALLVDSGRAGRRVAGRSGAAREALPALRPDADRGGDARGGGVREAFAQPRRRARSRRSRRLDRGVHRVPGVDAPGGGRSGRLRARAGVRVEQGPPPGGPARGPAGAFVRRAAAVAGPVRHRLAGAAAARARGGGCASARRRAGRGPALEERTRRRSRAGADGLRPGVHRGGAADAPAGGPVRPGRARGAGRPAEPAAPGARRRLDGRARAGAGRRLREPPGRLQPEPLVRRAEDGGALRGHRLDAGAPSGRGRHRGRLRQLPGDPRAHRSSGRPPAQVRDAAQSRTDRAIPRGALPEIAVRFSGASWSTSSTPATCSSTCPCSSTRGTRRALRTA